MKNRKIMLKSFFVFVSIFSVIGLNSAFAAGMEAKIKNVGLTGLLENSDRDAYTNKESMMPLDKGIHRVKFTYLNSSYSVPFLATYIKTIYNKKEKYYSDEVKIEYFSMALSDFYQHDAILKFKGYDKNGNILPVNKVVYYRKANKISSGWILKDSIFPVSEVTFTPKDFGKNKGVTDRAWFILHFSLFTICLCYNTTYAQKISHLQ